jgi:hypothetical protein
MFEFATLSTFASTFASPVVTVELPSVFFEVVLSPVVASEFKFVFKFALFVCLVLSLLELFEFALLSESAPLPEFEAIPPFADPLQLLHDPDDATEDSGKMMSPSRLP